MADLYQQAMEAATGAKKAVADHLAAPKKLQAILNDPDHKGLLVLIETTRNEGLQAINSDMRKKAVSALEKERDETYKLMSTGFPSTGVTDIDQDRYEAMKAYDAQIKRLKETETPNSKLQANLDGGNKEVSLLAMVKNMGTQDLKTVNPEVRRKVVSALEKERDETYKLMSTGFPSTGVTDIDQDRYEATMAYDAQIKRLKETEPKTPAPAKSVTGANR